MISIKRLMKWVAVPALAGIAVASVAAIALRPSADTEASSHREAPLISGDPLADATDTYAYLAPDATDKLTLVGNWIPLEEPAGGPNFYNFGDDVLYEFDIDNNGDAVDDVTYGFRFKTEVSDPATFLYATGPIASLSDKHYNIKQFYDVYRNGQLIASHLSAPPNNVGPASTPNYDALATQAVHPIAAIPGSKVFAGQRDDPFFVDLGGIFDLAQIRPGHAVDGVGGFNTNSIVLQVPLSDVTACKCDPAPDSPSAVVGVWTETYRSKVRVLERAHGPGKTESAGVQNSGPQVAVSRLGNPLVNEVVIPLAKKDAFNASEPKDDGQFLPFVLNSDLAAKLNAVYGFNPPIPVSDRLDLVTVFLKGIPGVNQPPNVVPSEELRLNVGIKPDSAACANFSTLGVVAGDACGFPNGRRLADDVTDVALRAVTCGYGFAFGPCPASFPNVVTGDGVDGNDKPFLSSFPYVAAPHSGFTHEHHTSAVVVPVSAGFGAAAIVLGLLLVGSQAIARRRRRAGAERN